MKNLLQFIKEEMYRKSIRLEHKVNRVYGHHVNEMANDRHDFIENLCALGFKLSEHVALAIGVLQQHDNEQRFQYWTGEILNGFIGPLARVKIKNGNKKSVREKAVLHAFVTRLELLEDDVIKDSADYANDQEREHADQLETLGIKAYPLNISYTDNLKGSYVDAMRYIMDVIVDGIKPEIDDFRNKIKEIAGCDS